MEVKLNQKLMIQPEKANEPRRILLSNIDLILVVYQESINFFNPPFNNMTFLEACSNLCFSLSRLLVPYDFFAGRLVQDDNQRFDCNGAGVVFAAATTETRLSQLGQLLEPKPEYMKLICFLCDEQTKVNLKDKPLLHVQLMQFGCGSLAMGIRFNHCVMDGIAASQFTKYWAALSRGSTLESTPSPDRTIFKHRDPPVINHPHLEFSTACQGNNSFTPRGTDGTNTGYACTNFRTRLIYLSAKHIGSIKKAALKDGKLKSCTTFQVVAAKIWKARTISMKMKDETVNMMLDPMSIRHILKPQVPYGFAGNGVLPCFV
ncbi:HXXXD-type acyl-transferase family protein [Euphorbia peplus]|nr:HXXXD-type acyl-transferase family protein [Euphorbia peplus]